MKSKLKILSARIEKKPRCKFHRIKPEDCERIKCQNSDCKNQADICEHCHWNTGNAKGPSFFYHCQSCFDEKFGGDVFAGEKLRLVNRESGAKDQTPPVGVIAKAVIENSSSGKSQMIQSGGTWTRGDISEAAQGQLADLKTELLALGIGGRAVNYAIKNCKF